MQWSRRIVPQMSITRIVSRREVSEPSTSTRSSTMKYVLMYTNRPDLDAAVPEERRDEVYQAIFAWFSKHGHVMADGGAELQGPETATTVKYGPNGGEPVVVDGPFSEAKENVG